MIICMAVLTEEVPTNMTVELQFNHKLLLRLLTNCVQKLTGMMKSQ
jgi:hypothetical protein